MHSRFMNKINQTGTQSCLPIRYQTIMKLSGVQPKMPICQDSKKEIWSNLLKTWNKFLTTCPNSCTQFEYQGKMKSLVGYVNDSKSVWMDYLFLSGYLEVHQEYLVYEMDDVIGSIGGTLGLFIGFSFHELLKYFIEIIKNHVLHTIIRNKQCQYPVPSKN